MKKKRSIPEYEKRSPFDRFSKPGGPRSIGQNLDGCIKEIFPDARPKHLTSWLKEMRLKSIELEPLLYMVLISGAQYRIVHPDVSEILAYIREWFAWGDDNHRMKEEIADIVVAALAPAIKNQVEETGYQRGWPHGPIVRKKGRPIRARGALVAAFVTENYLVQVGIKRLAAKNHAVGLASILMGRESIIFKREETDIGSALGLNNFYSFRKKVPETAITDLTKALMENYKFLLKQDGIRAEPQDLPPPENQIKKYSQWESRHKGLHFLIKDFGAEGFCKFVLGYIPSRLWEPFWDMKAS